MFPTREIRASTDESADSTESFVGDRKKVCVCALDVRAHVNVQTDLLHFI